MMRVVNMKAWILLVNPSALSQYSTLCYLHITAWQLWLWHAVAKATVICLFALPQTTSSSSHRLKTETFPPWLEITLTVLILAFLPSIPCLFSFSFFLHLLIFLSLFLSPSISLSLSFPHPFSFTLVDAYFLSPPEHYMAFALSCLNSQLFSKIS